MRAGEEEIMRSSENLLSNHRCELEQALEAEVVNRAIYFKFKYK